MKKLLHRLVSSHQNIRFSITQFIIGLVIFSHGTLKLLGLFDSISLVLSLCSRLWADTFTGIMLTTQLEHGFFVNLFGSHAGEWCVYALFIIDLAFVTSLNGSGKWSIDNLISKKL